MCKRYKGAVFFDIDGTLIDGARGMYMPSKVTMDALEKLKKNGYMIGIATGRAKCYIPKINIDFDCYVTTNGAYAEVNGEEVWNDSIPLKDLSDVVEYLESEKFGYVLESQTSCYYSEVGGKEFEKMVKAFDMDISCFYPLKDIDCIKSNKLNITYKDKEKYRTFIEKFKGIYDITDHPGNPSADVCKVGLTKAVGIKAVIEHFEINISDTYAFGDGDNDYDMLKFVGTGIAMGNHTERLNDIVEMITDTVQNEGIYKGLKKLQLI